MKTPITKLTTVTTAAYLSCFTLPALAQNVEVFEKTETYNVMQVATSKVCFSVYAGKSEDGSDFTFASYKTLDNDRWQVAGYTDDDKITSKSDLLFIKFDGRNLMARAVDFSRSDFVLPFTEDNDLKGFDAGVTTAKTMSFVFKNTQDTMNIDLDIIRKARTSVDACLDGLK